MRGRACQSGVTEIFRKLSIYLRQIEDRNPRLHSRYLGIQRAVLLRKLIIQPVLLLNQEINGFHIAILYVPSSNCSCWVQQLHEVII